jgi:predicted RecA/RadA family phage recombinase
MATNFLHPGTYIDCVAPTGGVVSGNGYLFGAMFGIAMTSANAGDRFTLGVEGVWQLPKAAAQAWTIGQIVNWDNAAKNVTTGAGTKIGVAAAAAASADAFGEVRLNESW